MDQMILCAIALVALRYWASAASWRPAVAGRQQARLGRFRVE